MILKTSEKFTRKKTTDILDRTKEEIDYLSEKQQLLCRSGLRKFWDLPKSAKQVQLVAYDRPGVDRLRVDSCGAYLLKTEMGGAVVSGWVARTLHKIGRTAYVELYYWE